MKINTIVLLQLFTFVHKLQKVCEHGSDFGLRRFSLYNSIKIEQVVRSSVSSFKLAIAHSFDSEDNRSEKISFDDQQKKKFVWTSAMMLVCLMKHRWQSKTGFQKIQKFKNKKCNETADAVLVLIISLKRNDDSFESSRL